MLLILSLVSSGLSIGSPDIYSVEATAFSSVTASHFAGAFSVDKQKIFFGLNAFPAIPKFTVARPNKD